jgi:glutaredoxin
MKIIRYVIGKILLALSAITLPKKEKRRAENKQDIKEELSRYSLYQFEACPFCIKVRRALHRLDLEVELRDSKADPYKTELLEKGGRLMAPCLRIQKGDDVTWMYESNDIISHLESTFNNG